MPLTKRSPIGSLVSSSVSPVCLGGISGGFEHQITNGQGGLSKQESFQRLDSFVSLGGNFLDSISLGQQDQSEQRIGEWMKQRGNRKEMVIATKYTAGYKAEKPPGPTQSSKDLAADLSSAVDNSLRNLQTTYIDILYVDFWDWSASIEQTMDSLDGLVKQLKVLNLGSSDTPAWVVSQANQYARDKGLCQFSVYQGHWSFLLRDFQHKILPMCMSERMALCPWGQLETGKVRHHVGRTNDSVEGVNSAFLQVGKDLGTLDVTAVALAYALSKFHSIFPIIGVKHFEHFHSKITSLSVRLTPEHIRLIEELTSDKEEISDNNSREAAIKSDEKTSSPPWYFRLLCISVDT